MAHSGLITAIILCVRTGDARAFTIFYACNICLAPLGYMVARVLVGLALRLSYCALAVAPVAKESSDDDLPSQKICTSTEDTVKSTEYTVSGWDKWRRSSAGYATVLPVRPTKNAVRFTMMAMILGVAVVEAVGAGAGAALPGEEDDLWML